MFKPVDPNTNFPEMEKKWLKHWYKKGIVKKYLLKNKNSKKYFSFLDGPITANNPMGVHHAWGRTYKDLWPKFFNLLGYRQRFQSGFDCQGLWVEVEVEKELGLRSKKDIENLIPGDRKASIAKFVELCKQRVYKFSKIQTEQTKRLGNFMDWDHSYFTMSDENNYMIWHFLQKCYKNGWIYKGHESVPWCPRCETAISEHEILTEDYKLVGHESVNCLLPIIDRKNEYLMVWTTTPWTIPANIAVAVDEKLDYSLVETNDGYSCWVAKEAVNRVFKKGYKKIVRSQKGKELVGLKYEAPYDDLEVVKRTASENPDKFHLVIPTDDRILPISTQEGTGLVHTAVSAGTEDFKLGKKLGLPMIPVIADNADYLPTLGFLAGINAKKNPRIVLDYLVEKDEKGPEKWVYEIFNYKHRYPGCWRCKAELVWKVADEWYIAMDKFSISKSQISNNTIKQNTKLKNKTLRQRMIEVAKKIKWMPKFGLDRELDWLKNMHDWLISKKNRYWGLALPIYECKKCATFEVIGSKDELKKRAVSGWGEFEGHTPHKPFIDEVKISCAKCDNEVKRVDDVGNPWLDAGIVGYSTITDNNQGEPLYLTDSTKGRSSSGRKKEWKKWFPADFITESFPGQFKNWFYALIAESTVLENLPQFKTVLGFGTLLGEDGRPMHKSWGNSIEFNEGADKIGADVMRWMYARQNPSENMLFGYRRADEVRRQFYLMFWNVYKFLVEYSNLDKWVPSVISSPSFLGINSARNLAKPKVRSLRSLDSSVASLLRNDCGGVLDHWILNRFYWLGSYVEESLKKYNVKDAALETEKFVSDLSTWYIRRSRDRVWVNSDNIDDKQWFYQTLHYILANLAIVVSPILPFLSEEIYTNLTDEQSIHLANWPKWKVQIDSNLILDMQLVRKISEIGHSVRKELKLKIRQPLSAMTIYLPKGKSFNKKNVINDYLSLVTAELNVKKVDLRSSKDESIKVEFDTTLTLELIMEGKLRNLIREIQSTRKQLGVKPTQKVELTIPAEFADSLSFIKHKVLAQKVKLGQKLGVSL